ncbi:hypothetical protein M5C96_12475 [Acidovorax sp. GBBC 1281]|nr:hypothetical protein M5C96_12475 [Acidovorax sp. GBBC 1281]
MPRRFIAVLIFHFLLCVGFSAAGLNPAFTLSHDQGPTEHSLNAGSGIPVAFSDADDHALMDDKGELPDQLEPRAPLTSYTANPVAAVPLRINKAPSAIKDPPHKPPKVSGLVA